MWKKIIIPKFNGTNDLEAYLAWEMKLDKIFNSIISGISGILGILGV